MRNISRQEITQPVRILPRESIPRSVLFLFAVVLGVVLTHGEAAAYGGAGGAGAGIEVSEEISEVSLPPFNEQIARKAFAEAMRGQNAPQQQTFCLFKSDPEEIGRRFLAILPPELSQSTQYRVDETQKTLTITGPPQAIASAGELIPRMDANLQLDDGRIDYGLAAAPVDNRPAELPEEDKPSEPYYDPNENRVVRTLSEPPKNAILPPSSESLGMAVLGQDSASVPTGPDAEQTPDVAVYACPPMSIAVAVARLKQSFAQYPEVTITSDPQAGKIIVYTTRRRHAEIKSFLDSIGIKPFDLQSQPACAPQQAAAPQYAVGAAPAGPANGNPAAVQSASAGVPLKSNQRPNGEATRKHTAVYKNIASVETELTNLLQDRVERIAPADPNDPSLSPAQRENSVWRFTRRPKEGAPVTEEPAPSCDLAFDRRQQTVSVSGDPRLVDQMMTLIESIDNSGKAGASRPRYIFLKNVDPAQLKEIFELQQQNTPQAASGAKDNPIRPVSWQEDGLGALGADVSVPASVPASIPGGGDAAGPNQIDLVPDFVPLVLPDLDMVILDAPEAEAKRIIEMIDKIEALAAEAEPQTEIHYLKHVNSVMLSGVLARLFDEMFATKQGRVLVYALQNPNAILLVGWGEAPKAMKALIDTFDQPIQNDGSLIQVVKLQFASAQEVARMLTDYFTTATPDSGGMAPRIRVIPDPRTNSLVIHAAANDFEEVKKVLAELDVNRSNTKLQVKTFRLRHSLAEDIRKSISQAILPAMEGTLPSSEAKYPILQIMTVDADSRKLIESGIMRDVQLSSDIQTYQLTVTATADCMDIIGTLIAILDTSPASGQIKMFPLRYADATQVMKTLQQLLPTGGGQMPSIPNAEGEQSFVPVRFSIDPRSNCLLIAASPLDLKIIDSLIIAMDRKDSAERQQQVIQLRNVNAASIAEAVNRYLTEKQRLELSSGSVSDYQLFDSQVIVVPEGNTNSIIISATPKYLQEITKLIESFDKEPAEVDIQVLIAQVILSDDEEFGFEAGLQDEIAFDRSLVTSVTNGVNSATGNPGFDLISNNTQGNNYLSNADPSDLAGTAVSALGMGRTSTDLGYGGLVLSASSNSIQILLRALREKNRIQILSRPQIQAMDNQQAFILIGQRVPRISGTTTSSYAVTSNVTEANVGLILLVTPRISEDGRVIMEIGAEKSSLGSDSDAIPIYTSGNQVIKSPTIDTTQVMTAVSAVDGETVMLGGLISSSKTKISRGVPLLSDIPVVGWLFRYDKADEERRELIIVMTPRIVRDRCDSERIKRIEASKMSWCLADAMAINGSMGLYDPLTQRGKTQGAVRSLPFLEMDKLDEVPPSTHRPYNPSNDFPASGPAVSNPNAVMPPVETLPDGVTRQTQRAGSAGSTRSAE
ncbi:MAG: hypothetical protein IJG83_02605 [Thermoguttaceae bacterium]|nr:hypothetical protein [Thermoguttaceae bacterium]